MAEQLRRLYTMAAQWDIEVTIVHTPGKLLVQNDAVSRGKDPEKPRKRFIQSEFDRMTAEWGPFESGIGAEMERTQHSSRAEVDPREEAVWYHPSHRSVAATLKYAWSRVAASRSGNRADGHRHIRGCIVLPLWEGAAWQQLAAGMRMVRRWEPGERVLEEWRGAVRGWVPVKVITPTGLFVFPAVTDMRLIRADTDEGRLAAGDYAVQRWDEEQLVLYKVCDDDLGGGLCASETPVIEMIPDGKQKPRDRYMTYRFERDTKKRKHSFADGHGAPWGAPTEQLYKVTRYVSQDKDDGDKVFLDSGRYLRLFGEPEAGDDSDGSFGSGWGSEQGEPDVQELAALEVTELEALAEAAPAEERPVSPRPATKLREGLVVPRFGREFDMDVDCKFCGLTMMNQPAVNVTWAGSAGGWGGWVHQLNCKDRMARSRTESPSPAKLLFPEKKNEAAAKRPRRTKKNLFGVDLPAGTVGRLGLPVTRCMPCAQPLRRAGDTAAKRGKKQRDGGENVRTARHEERLSEQRLERCRLCLTGACEDLFEDLGERDITCMGCSERTCGQAVHSRCFNTAPGVSGASLFICPACRVAGLALVDGATEDDVELLCSEALEPCVRRLTGMASGTGRVIEQVRKKQVMIEEEKKLDRYHLFTTVRGLQFFADWLCKNGLAASADLYTRIAGQLGARDAGEGGKDLSQNYEVKRTLKEFEKVYGTDKDADTPLPHSMFMLALRKLQGHHRPIIAARDALSLVFEYQGGCRVGEATGDIHGWQLQQHTMIFHDRVEVRLDDSKMSNTAEFVTMARHTTQSQLDAGQMIIDMAEANGRTWTSCSWTWTARRSSTTGRGST